MIEIVSFDISNKKLSEIAFQIRTDVFVREQNVPHELEYDGSDDEATHYLLYADKKPVATARWRLTGKGVKSERFAVLAEYRNKGLGAELVKRVLEDTLKLNKPIYLHSQIKAVSFYERHGFVKEGVSFFEAGIEHYYMIYRG
jgi:predicted GNAT family N-acyltransferase